MLRSEPVYDGGWLRVLRQAVRLPDGRVVEDYHHVEVPDCSVIYAETEAGGILVERQYKHGPGRIGLSLPAGALHVGEDPLAGARRELLEETGYAAPDWRSCGSFSVNGNYGVGKAHLFHARGARRVAEPDSGDLEEMEVLEMPRAQLVDALQRGEVHLLCEVALIALTGPALPPAKA